MEEREPALVAVHRQDPPGKIHPESRERFALFLVGWLGGPDDYLRTHGHPRLRMRHGHVAIDPQLRDAWVRTMSAAMDRQGVSGPVREYLDARFVEVAAFLQNR